MKIILMIFCSIALFFCYLHFGCTLRWHGTGYKVKYSMMAGCLVQQSNDKWLPEDKVRPE